MRVEGSRYNLVNIADAINFLNSNSSRILEKGFNMRRYRIGDKRSLVCSSCGCLIGWTTELDKKIKGKKYRKINGVIDFFGWSLDFYFNKYENKKEDCKRWNFLFSSNWFYDNYGWLSFDEFDIVSIEQLDEAIARLEYVLENGDIPQKWNYNYKLKFYK